MFALILSFFIQSPVVHIEAATPFVASIQQEAPVRTPEIRTVPFYSQFTDVSAPEWKKVSCGIASLAMVMDYYGKKDTSVDSLLAEGIDAGAYLTSAGWTYAGLIGVSRQHAMDGESYDLAGVAMPTAFTSFEKTVQEGPTIASVHYTFEPTNPIPHLVVVTAIANGYVYYNDPADTAGGGKITIEKFQGAWKKRFIVIRPV
jgi:predicted double-glycine peptidase